MTMAEETSETTTYMGYWRFRFICTYQNTEGGAPIVDSEEYPSKPDLEDVVKKFETLSALNGGGKIVQIEEEVVVKCGVVFPINK